MVKSFTEQRMTCGTTGQYRCTGVKSALHLIPTFNKVRLLFFQTCFQQSIDCTTLERFRKAFSVAKHLRMRLSGKHIKLCAGVSFNWQQVLFPFEVNQTELDWRMLTAAKVDSLSLSKKTPVIKEENKGRALDWHSSKTSTGIDRNLSAKKIPKQPKEI